MKKVFLVFLISGLLISAILFLFKNRSSDFPAVKILSQNGKKKALFLVELAKTKEERERGLMFRKELPERRSMFFIFNQEGPRWFWMKNTLIPLDIIFINQDQKIVGTVTRATPESKKLLGGWKSKFVLEVNGGLAEKYGIKEGDKIEFRNLDI